jgi:hypothetical protein
LSLLNLGLITLGVKPAVKDRVVGHDKVEHLDVVCARRRIQSVAGRAWPLPPGEAARRTYGESAVPA